MAGVACFTSSGLCKPTYPGVHGGYSGAHGAYGSFAPGGGLGYHGPPAVTVVLPSGHLADTPEVAAAKGAHHAAVAEAAALAGPYDGGYDSGAGTGGSYGYDGGYHGGAGAGGYGYGGAYRGPLASSTVLASGYLADTHEVTALRSAHLSALSAASAASAAHGVGYAGGYGGGAGGHGGGAGGYGGGAGYSGGGGAGYGGYHGPLAIPVVLPSGHIADTHEVAAAKTAHLNAVAHSASRSGSHGYHAYHH